MTHTTKHLGKEIVKIAETLIHKSVCYDDYSLYIMAVELIGQGAVTRYKIDNNLHLLKNDYDYLKSLIQEQKERIDRILSE